MSPFTVNQNGFVIDQITIGASGSGHPLLFTCLPWALTTDDDLLPSVAATSAFVHPCDPVSYPLLPLTWRKFGSAIQVLQLELDDFRVMRKRFL